MEKHHVNMLLESFRPVCSQRHQGLKYDLFKTLAVIKNLRIESFAVTDLYVGFPQN